MGGIAPGEAALDALGLLQEHFGVVAMGAFVDDGEAVKNIKLFSTDSQEVKCMGIFHY